jgi:hypothetical protein
MFLWSGKGLRCVLFLTAPDALVLQVLAADGTISCSECCTDFENAVQRSEQLRFMLTVEPT